MTIEMEDRADNSVIAEGKTKIIAGIDGDDEQVHIIAKNVITAGDGAKHDFVLGKAALATRTTCNVFRLLQACGIPVAFTEQVDDITFRAPLCTMLPYEVVARREGHGSYLKRMPGFQKGHLFPNLLVEFFLKTNNRKWKEHDLLCDDPLMDYQGGPEIALFEPAKPMHTQEPFLILRDEEVFSQEQEGLFFEHMEKLARRIFLILEKAWQLQGRTLVDFKVEFGLSPDGILLLADVIDNDSWRVVENGAYIDKQVYRDGGAIDDVLAKYRLVADITDHFTLPTQQVIVWRGSDSDDVDPIMSALHKLSGGSSSLFTGVTCSMHKEPVVGLQQLHTLVQAVPDTVVIAYIGRSNGAGPTLSAATTVPVITVPESFKKFPDDVWSSLRAPSQVPVMTVLEPANAALAALEILALRNPLLYMFLREQVEKRLVNTVLL